jgi:hypothetical protein
MTAAIATVAANTAMKGRCEMDNPTPISCFDDAMLAYMDLYYVESDPKTEFYRSCSDPRNVLSFHKNLIAKDEIIAEVFEGEDPHWFFLDGSTPRQLIEKAVTFRDGFFAFIATLEESVFWAILKGIEAEVEAHNRLLASCLNELWVQEKSGAVLPYNPTDN